MEGEFNKKGYILKDTEEVKSYFDEKDHLILFPPQARDYLGLKEIDSGWDIVYQYYGYNDSYREGAARTTFYFEGNIIRKIIHESISGHYDIHDNMQYHEIDAYIETLDRMQVIAKRFREKEIPLNYVKIGRMTFDDSKNQLLIHIDKLYGSSTMFSWFVHEGKTIRKQYSNFENICSGEEAYEYMCSFKVDDSS